MAKHLRRKNRPDWEDVMILTGGHMPDASFRNMVENVHLGCNVEAWHTKQGGTVVDILKDFYGRAACLKVEFITEDKNGQEVLAYDLIPVDRVSFYEPANIYVPDDEYYDDDIEETAEWLLANGYVWDDELGYVNHETGDCVVW